jgi:hypothetical protein
MLSIRCTVAATQHFSLRPVHFLWAPNLVPARPDYAFPASEPTTAFNKNWVWGGAAQVGTTYAFAGGWFLHLCGVGPVTIFNQKGPLTTSGSAVLNAQERVTNQSLTITLNYLFH